ncbi:hypothetical protein G7Y89_g7611 [Cudoniella acicularis]|uniref:Uncharacterized protein n=1 Tax=Cudoniella acicularis TaxID=354080 RepID=A0A8H4W4D7_9HELO|nr:hypothetical protein G7Y89_g7611 [Cudoniella acicularis]
MALFRFFYPRTSFYTLSSKERLLQNPHSEKEEKQYEEYEAVKPRPSDSLTIKTLLVITLFLLTSNTYLLIYRQNSLIKDDHLLRFSKFAKLAYDTPITYHTHTDYQSKNQTLQNEMWDSIDTSPLVVTLTDEYATSHDIPLSKFRFPWDAENKGVYYLKTYHHLHCLVFPLTPLFSSQFLLTNLQKAIRKSLLNHEHGLPQYSTGKYTQLATAHHTQGLTLYHSILTDINQANYSASIAFSSLTTMFAFGVSRPLMSKEKEGAEMRLLDDLAQIFLLVKGWHKVVRVADDLECRGGSKIFSSPESPQNTNTLSPDTEEAFTRLSALNRDRDPSDTILYTNAISSLKASFFILENEGNDNPHTALEWANTLPEEFLRLIWLYQTHV